MIDKISKLIRYVFCSMQRAMLTQLTARLRARQGGADGPGGGVILGEDGETVIVDDNCEVSLLALLFGSFLFLRIRWLTMVGG